MAEPGRAWRRCNDRQGTPGCPAARLPGWIAIYAFDSGVLRVGG
jgi:hypothetical protein